MTTAVEEGARVAMRDFSIGQTAESTRTNSEAEVMAFAAVSGDVNPVHVDAEAAAQSPFSERIVNGMRRSRRTVAWLVFQICERQLRTAFIAELHDRRSD